MVPMRVQVLKSRFRMKRSPSLILAVALTALLAGRAPAAVPPTVAEGATFEAIYRSPKFFEGPTWDAAGQRLFFTAFGKEESDTSILAW